MSWLSKALGVDIDIWAELKKDLVEDVQKAEAWATGQFPALKQEALVAIQGYLAAHGDATQAEATAYANSQVDAWITALVAAAPAPAELAAYKDTIRNTLVTLANTAVDGWIGQLFQIGEQAATAAEGSQSHASSAAH